MNSADVFFLAASEDRDLVKQIVHGLEGHGLSVHEYILSNQSGALDSKHEAKYAGASSVVVLWSENSTSSAYLRDIALDALESGRLVPAAADTSALPIGFRTLQTAQLSNFAIKRANAEWDSFLSVLLARCRPAQREISGQAPESDFKVIPISVQLPSQAMLFLQIAFWATSAIFPIVAITLALQASYFFTLVSLSDFFLNPVWNPYEVTKPQFGLPPLLIGSVMITLLTLTVALPIGWLAGRALAGIASRRLRGAIRNVVDVVAGVPAVAYAFVGVQVLDPLARSFAASLGYQLASNSVLVTSLTLGISLLPYIVILFDEVISAHSISIMSGSTATRSQLNKGLAGASLIIASRCFGETMVLVMLGGYVASLSINPFDSSVGMTNAITRLFLGDGEPGQAKLMAAFALSASLFLICSLLNYRGVVLLRPFRLKRELESQNPAAANVTPGPILGRFALFASMLLALAGPLLVVYMAVSSAKRGLTEYRVQLTVPLTSLIESGVSLNDEKAVRNADLWGLVTKIFLAEVALGEDGRIQRRELIQLLSHDSPEKLANAIALSPLPRDATVVASFLISDVGQDYLKLGVRTGKISDRQALAIDSLNKKGSISAGIRWNFFLNGDSRDPEIAGIAGSLRGSLMTVIIAVGLSLPLGILTAVYLGTNPVRTYFSRILEAGLEALAAIPHLLVGVVGTVLLTWIVGLPRSSPLAMGFVLAMVTLPVVILMGRAAIRSSVGRMRSSQQTGADTSSTVGLMELIWRSKRGLFAGVLISCAQAFAVGEAVITIGSVAFIVDPPTSILGAATTLPVQIYLWSDLPERSFVDLAAVAIFVLMSIVLVFRSLAVLVRGNFPRALHETI